MLMYEAKTNRSRSLCKLEELALKIRLKEVDVDVSVEFSSHVSM